MNSELLNQLAKARMEEMLRDAELRRRVFPSERSALLLPRIHRVMGRARGPRGTLSHSAKGAVSPRPRNDRRVDWQARRCD